MRQLILTDSQRQELLYLRDRAPQPYLRERASALLKVAAGMPAAVIARPGMLKPRQPDTIYDWLTRFQSESVTGLKIRAGHGRKPALFPLSTSGSSPRGRSCCTCAGAIPAAATAAGP